MKHRVRKLNLRNLRKDKGMTQEKVAQFLNVSRTYYSQIESGTLPGRELSYKIADFYGVDVRKLF